MRYIQIESPVTKEVGMRKDIIITIIFSFLVFTFSGCTTPKGKTTGFVEKSTLAQKSPSKKLVGIPQVKFVGKFACLKSFKIIKNEKVGRYFIYHLANSDGKVVVQLHTTLVQIGNDHFHKKEQVVQILVRRDSGKALNLLQKNFRSLNNNDKNKYWKIVYKNYKPPCAKCIEV